MAPQAYTKQILQEAFEWWSEQPESFRSQIQDSDDLVGYYLRIHRGKAPAVVETNDGFSKASKESFSSELKGLAEDLSTFEVEGNSEFKNARPRFMTTDARINRPKKQQPSQEVQPQLQQQTQPQPHQPVRKTVPSSNQQQLTLPTMSNQLMVSQAMSEKPVESISGEFFKLDGRSLKMVKEARELLNLSSDEEALRALISFGAQKFKNLLKP